MNRELNDDRFVSIASAIAEGAPVEWSAEDSESVEDSEILQELKSLEAIASAHAHLRRTFDDPEMTTDRPLSAHQPPRLGDWGHLTIIAKIDEGAFGSVYKAHDNRLAKDVALKLLPPHTANATRMLKEARLLAKVNHPNVVRVYGADDTQERVGLWMEFIKGRTLENLLRAQGAFGAREAALIGLDICHAVAAVHHAGLIHGDIKAHNVMREEGGRTVLMDFGASHDLSLSTRAHVVGTPVYLAPEVLAGLPQSRASDIYAIGVLLYHLVTSGYPINGASWSDVIDKHEGGEAVRLRDARPDLPEEFVRVVERAIESDPACRHESVGAFAAALSHFIEPSPTLLPRGRSPKTLFIGLTAVLAVAALSTCLLRSPAATTLEPARVAAPAPLAPAVPPAAPAAASYDIDAGFYRVTNGSPEVLTADARLTTGDRLFFTVQTTVPTYIYIVNEPEQGEPFLLFPLPGSRVQNPVPANDKVRLPGDVYWQVTSAGGREHFVVFASPERVPAFEEAFAALATPGAGPVPHDAAPLSAATAEKLRGVGGLAPANRPAASGAKFSSLFTTPLSGTRETAQGLWVRRLTVANPAR